MKICIVPYFFLKNTICRKVTFEISGFSKLRTKV